MIIDELKKHDSSLELCFFNLDKDHSFESIKTLDNICENIILFASGLNYFKEFLLKIESTELKTCLLIVSKKIIDHKLYIENENTLKQKLGGVCHVEDAEVAMSFLSKPFYERLHCERNEMVDGRQMGTAIVHPTANIAQNVFIGEGVKIAEDVTILSGCVISSFSSIGKGSVLYPNVSIGHDVIIGENCRIHSGTVIGADGFGYNHKDGIHHKLWHLGSVLIEDDVEIGANCCVDRGSFKNTFIGQGTKLDNSVHIAHNCKLGKGVIVCGQCGLAGSAVLEDYAVLGGQAAIGPGVTVGMASQVGGGARVTKSFPAKSKVSGYPARALNEWLRANAALNKLSEKRKS